MNNLKKALHLAVGRALRLDYAQYRGPEACWVGTGIALPPTPLVPYPGYTPPTLVTGTMVTARAWSPAEIVSWGSYP